MLYDTTPAPAAHSSEAVRLIAFLGRVDDDYGFDDAIRDAAAEGYGFRLTWYDPTTAYREVWEHPAATEHNAEIDRSTAAILDLFLFKLFELQTESPAAPYILVVGRVGNTVNYEISTPG